MYFILRNNFNKFFYQEKLENYHNLTQNIENLNILKQN